jgi:hypothetical protein
VATAKAKQVEVRKLTGATYDSVEDFVDITKSSGFVDGAAVSSNGDGTVAVTAGKGLIRKTSSDIGNLHHFDIPATDPVSLADDSLNYVYADYNAGSPQVVATTDITTLDHTSEFVLALVYRDGNHLHIIEAGQKLNNFIHSNYFWQWEVQGFQRASGIVTSETGTRNVAVTAGVVYYALNRIVTAAFDSSAADTFDHYWYRDGIGGWTDVGTTETQINNLNYDDGDGTLGVLTANRYGVHWLYMHSDGDVSVVFGRGDYTLAGAEVASAPSDLPPEISATAFLIAKIIIQKSASSFTSISIPWEDVVFGAAPTSHTSLADLTTGDAGHTQFLLLNGSTPMTGDLDMDGNDIDLDEGSLITLNADTSNDTTMEATSTRFRLTVEGNPILDVLTSSAYVLGLFGADEITLDAGMASYTVAGSAIATLLGSGSELGTPEVNAVHAKHTSTSNIAGARMTFLRSRGTQASPTVVQDGDYLGAIDFGGYDGTDFGLAGRIQVEVDGTPGAGDMPGKMIFQLSPDAAEVPTDVLTLGEGKTATFEGILAGPTGDSISFLSNETDGASAVGFLFNTTNDLGTAGALLMDFQNQGSSKFVVDYRGYFGVATSAPQSTLHLNGGFSALPVDHTVASPGLIREVFTCYGFTDTAGGNIQPTFAPLSLVDERMYWIRNYGTAGYYIMDGSGTETIEGSLTYTLYEKGSKYLRHFDAYDDTGGLDVTSGAAIPLDTEVTKHLSGRLYSHSTSVNPSEVTLERDGLYRITVDCTTEVTTGTVRCETDMWVEVDTGGGFAEISGTRRTMYNRIAGNGTNSVSCTFTYDASSGDILRVWAVRAQGTQTIETVADGTRMNIDFIGRCNDSALMQARNGLSDWKLIVE